MNNIKFSRGFRIVGSPSGLRRPVDHAAAFQAHAECDDRAQIERECYLSVFQFDESFDEHIESTGSTARFSGPCWARWIWFDIDRDENLEDAQDGARKLTSQILDRFSADEACLMIFFSGSKGFHIGVPTSLWGPVPSGSFHLVAKQFAVELSGQDKVRIDGSVYSKVQLLRAPNSRHPKTGLHKCHLTVDSLFKLSIRGILERAKAPCPFDVPEEPANCTKATTLWQSLVETVEHQTADSQRFPKAKPTRLNRSTIDFIRDGAVEGERANRLFSAAANLAEFGCPPDLAKALLEEAALDSGLKPKEMARQIESAFNHLKGEA